MQNDCDGPARLVDALAAELLQLGRDLTQLQNQLARPVGGGLAGTDDTLPQGLAAAEIDRIVALQDLDRLTQTAAALGTLCGRVAASMRERPHPDILRKDLSAALQLVPLGAVRDRMARSLGGDDRACRATPVGSASVAAPRSAPELISGRTADT